MSSTNGTAQRKRSLQQMDATRAWNCKDEPGYRGLCALRCRYSALPLENFSNDTCCATGGWKQIFSNTVTPTNELNIGTAHLPPRRADQESFETLHRHKQAEFYYMLQGSCIVRIDGVEHICRPGHALFIPGNAEHGFWKASTEEELIFLWDLVADGYHEIIYHFSERSELISDRKDVKA